MNDSPLVFVTANLEKGHKPTTRDWLDEAISRRPACLFLQEFRDLDHLSALARQHGYALIRPPRVEPHWWVVTSLLIRDDLQPRPLDSTNERLITVFGSYVAGAKAQLPGVGEAALVSLHASPTAVTDHDLARWVGELPRARDGGAGRRPRPTLYYSDLVVEALRRLGERTPVLAAGDMNEAREWDDGTHHEGHTWGREFFELVELSNLVDVTYNLWHEERQTRFHSTHPRLQLDRVIASPSVAATIETAEVDPAWSSPDLLAQSDHAPVWFRLAPTAG